MIYLYDDVAKKRVELEEIIGIDKDSNILIILMDCTASNEVIKTVEKSLIEKTGRKCVVLPKGFTVLGIK
ncbi:MAG: hypothetical protein K0Q87_3530 [Neobacillus sp.]|jgi:hypothetical protein|nr:hypothetical protein [Neobacillus sp.]